MTDVDNLVSSIEKLIADYKHMRSQFEELLSERDKHSDSLQWQTTDVVPDNGERVVIVRKGCVMFDVYYGFWLPGTECWLRLPERK